MAKEFETIETTATEVETTAVEPMETDTTISTDDEGLSKTAIGLIAGGCVAALTAAAVAGKKLYTKHHEYKAEKQRQKDIVALFDAGKLVAAEEPKEAELNEEPKEAVAVEIEPEPAKEPEKKKK